ncbi:hypothetical protein ACRC7T_08305 [Segnochrobactraceae bacterium EtOH-i3]
MAKSVSAVPAEPEDLFASWATAVNPIDLARLPAGPKVGYIKWIPEHSDVLISRIVAAHPEITFIDCAIFSGQEVPDIRRDITRAAERQPRKFRRIVLSALIALKARGLECVIMTLDWPAPFREIVFACRSIGIRTILVPHEGVFATVEQYYRQKRRGTNAPLCDYTLCWGELQRTIFTGRGYPAERIIKVGPPKFDADVLYAPMVTTSQARAVFGIAEGMKIIAFTMQPMDNYVDKDAARARQAQAISDVLDYAEDRGCFLLVRTPPSRDQVIPEELMKRLTGSMRATLDVAGEYVLGPEEMIAQSDLIVSVNSTMLFEARLMGKPAVAMKYIDLPSMWENTDVAFVTDKDAFFATADALLARGPRPLSEAAHGWATAQFSDDRFGFDGKALDRIGAAMQEILARPPAFFPIRLDRGGAVNEAVLRPAVAVVTNGLMRKFGADVLARGLGVVAVHDCKTDFRAAAGDIFVASPDTVDARFEKTCIELGRPLHMLGEDDLVRLRELARKDSQPKPESATAS